jgi:PH (Pleckstrin Homology) domain-containing protein/putative oligomerization/nucleic acid binding protein
MTDNVRPDIQAARNRMRVRFGGGREIRKLVEYLWEGETVERMTTGAYGKGTGLVVLTARRLFFIQDGVLSKTSEDFPLEKVSSVQWSSGMLMGSITIFASGNKAEIKNVQKDDGKEIVDLIRHRLTSPPPVQRAEAAPAEGPDVYDQLRKLGELRDAGVLTPEEFDEKKSRLLAQL